jgi:hypothetical protein
MNRSSISISLPNSVLGRDLWLRRCEARLLLRLPHAPTSELAALASSSWSNTSLVLLPEEAADLVASFCVASTSSS